jgi:DNA replication and repair protein RecF
MGLLSLEARDFRCLEVAQLELDPRCTFIVGENGAGKTSVLEAIYVLSCGHSFRSSKQNLLIKEGAQSFLTVGRVGNTGSATVIGVQGFGERTDVHIGGRRTQGFAELAAVLPTQVIDPEVHRLLEDGPKARRRFIDWGVFHVEPLFLEVWRRYQKALRQRNAALRAKLPRSEIAVWDDEFSFAGTVVAEQRQRYIDGLQVFINQVAGGLLNLPVRLEHKPGWSGDTSLEQAVQAAWKKDERYLLTTVGPHRADLAVMVNGTPAKERISRGQQKLLASAMLLAQILYRMKIESDPVCLLLDDPAAELDVDNLKKLMAEIAKIPAQLVVTALDLRSIDRYLSGSMFHVKQGRVSPML